jgi:MauM/NapG family ferredoxin protein
MRGATRDRPKRVKALGRSKWWRRLRQAVQVLALLLFLYLLLGAHQRDSLLLPDDLFFRLDPLAGISAMLASRSWMAPMALGGVTLLLTLAVGRAWCGWICPLGTLVDWMPARRLRRNGSDIPSYWRQGKYFLLFVILLAAALGSMTLLVLDPIALVFQTVGSVLLPGLSSRIAALEEWLYDFEALQPTVEWFDGLIQDSALAEQNFFLPSLLIALPFVVILALNAIRPRFWCRYLCPLGGFLGLLANVAQIRHNVDAEKCKPCQLCVSNCPTGAIEPERGFAANAAECTTCLDCVEICPRGAISFRGAWGLVSNTPQDPSRRRFLVSLGAAAVGAALLWVFPFADKTKAQLVRPPGANEEDLLSRCIRCGECVNVCPTDAIQPSHSATELEALWAPRLVPRLGYCDFSCNSCGQVCPTGAIPELALDEKRRTPIGIARIDRERCIPWAEGRDCIVCEEMCPVPEKAIRVDEQGKEEPDGVRPSILRPVVVERLCIGCGICEYHCPVDDEAAIRVFPLD